MRMPSVRSFAWCMCVPAMRVRYVPTIIEAAAPGCMEMRDVPVGDCYAGVDSGGLEQVLA